VSWNEDSQVESIILAVADESCGQASVVSSPAGPTLLPSDEELASGKRGRTSLKGEHLSEFIDLLVSKGARILIQTEKRR
jgi:hypothetical protein